MLSPLFTGDRIKYNLRYTQKKLPGIHFAILTINNNIWPYLLWSPVILIAIVVAGRSAVTDRVFFFLRLQRTYLRAIFSRGVAFATSFGAIPQLGYIIDPSYTIYSTATLDFSKQICCRYVPQYCAIETR